MKYDDLVDYLGELGPYQRRIYFFACLPCITAAIHALVPVFILAAPDSRCAIPGYPNDTFVTKDTWHQSLIDYTLPWRQGQDDDDDDSKWGDAQCKVFTGRSVDNYIVGQHHGGNAVNATEDCDEWVYDTDVFENSLVTELDLVCDKVVLRSHANMVYMCGLLFGSFLFGFLSDTFGRKPAFLLALLINAAATIAMAFVQDFITFAVIRFIVGACSMGIFMCCFVLGIEILGKRYRAQAGIGIQFFWCFGMFLMNLLAYLIRDWRHLQLALSCYSVLYLFLYWVVPESPRWQISRGLLKQARETMEKVAKSNGKELPPNAFDDDDDDVEGDAMNRSTSSSNNTINKINEKKGLNLNQNAKLENQNSSPGDNSSDCLPPCLGTSSVFTNNLYNEDGLKDISLAFPTETTTSKNDTNLPRREVKSNIDNVLAKGERKTTTASTREQIVAILKSPVFLIRVLIVFFNWAVITMIYYGLSLNVASLPGSIYVNFAFSGAVEVLSNIAALCALPTIGRKAFHCFCMILGGAACLGSSIPQLVDTSVDDWIIVLLTNVGRFGASAAFSTIFVYTAELFPTFMRNSVVGASSMVGRLFGIGAPYIADLGTLVGGKTGKALPFLLFGSASVLAGLMALTLPETLNAGTPETMEDSINLGKKPSKKSPQ